MRRFPWRILPLVVGFVASLAAAGDAAQSEGVDRRIDFEGEFSQAMELAADEVIEISAGVVSPSTLPPNGRLVVEWDGPAKDAGWRKVLHALDPDVMICFVKIGKFLAIQMGG